MGPHGDEVPNRLARETSPYLRQHANNPVDWYPWGEEALRRARSEDKPILLSIGYAACHWCHVMEHESFENDETARQMNESFISIKVDREERPDLDEIYMRAVQSFTGGRGGWPMTVFLTPAGEPFFGGTYFPPERRGGMPGFRDVLMQVSTLWSTERGRIEAITPRMREMLESTGRTPPAADALSPAWLDKIVAGVASSFDARNGGFGGAPKFPPHGTLAVLLAHHRITGDEASLSMFTATLEGMSKGGMYDHLGGGFARYSVDSAWTIPHFEKMLYDNAQLLPVFVDGWKVTGNPTWARIAREIVGWVLGEMLLPEHGFAASTDADSPGGEGSFFVWTPAELARILGDDDGARVATLAGVTPQGTFEDGASVLRLEIPLEYQTKADRELLLRAFKALKAHRAARPAPARDDKAITAWNALMLGAMARAGAALGEPTWIEAASRCARFLLASSTANGRLMRSWKDRRATVLAYADDYAALAGALVDLYETTGEVDWLTRAADLADQLVALFWDDEAGTCWYTGSDAPALIVRSKHLIGGAEPSANGLAAHAFVRLGRLLGRDDLLDKAGRICRAYQGWMDKAPRALGIEALAAAWLANGGFEVAITGADRGALEAAFHAAYSPFAVLASLPGPDPRLPWTEGKEAGPDGAVAWVCEGTTCDLPTGDPRALTGRLANTLESRIAALNTGILIDTRVHAPGLPNDESAWLNTAQPLPLDSLRGNVVILDFWTYCCINCLHVLPELAAIERTFAGEPVAVIGVHSAKFPTEREMDSVRLAIERHGIRHPVVLDPEHTLWDAFAIRSWPTVVIVDPTGRIAWQRAGEVDRDELETVVRRVLDEARAAGTLGHAAWSAPEPRIRDSQLLFPGKLSIWPSAADQAGGRDPLNGGRLYVTDTGHHRILEASLSRGPDGWPVAKVLQTIGNGEPGFVDGEATVARFRDPQGTSRMGGALWVADTGNHAIRVVDLAKGDVGTAAGTGERGTGGTIDPQDTLGTPLRSPWDVAVAGTPAEPAVFIAMAGTHQLWVLLEAQRQIGAFAGSGAEDHVDGEVQGAALAQPSGLCLYGRFLFFVDSETSSVRAVDLEERQVFTAVGQGLFDFGDADGPVATALLQHPLALTVSDRDVYDADTFNDKIKRVRLGDNEVSTIVGGDPAILSEPGGIAMCGRFLVVADTNNHRIRVCDPKTREIRDLELASP
jgi:uncharacterized protein YyaL (SSP411 family)/thiol-disulfide isomerase/thioredoxin